MIRDLYYRLTDVTSPRWWFPVMRIFGGPEGQGSRTCYLTRITFGHRLYIHIFHREDLDRDPHDHPFEFWTFPVNQGYVERVFFPEAHSHCFRYVHVPRWRWSYRPAIHCHQITNSDSGRWPLITIVWRGHNVRRWGFWCYQKPIARTWVHWKSYFASAEHHGPGAGAPGVVANLPGLNDEACPGVGGTAADAQEGL